MVKLFGSGKKKQSIKENLEGTKQKEEKAPRGRISFKKTSLPSTGEGPRGVIHQKDPKTVYIKQISGTGAAVLLWDTPRNVEKVPNWDLGRKIYDITPEAKKVVKNVKTEDGKTQQVTKALEPEPKTIALKGCKVRLVTPQGWANSEPVEIEAITVKRDEVGLIDVVAVKLPGIKQPLRDFSKLPGVPKQALIQKEAG